MIALLLGTLLAVAALAFVLWPLFGDATQAGIRPTARAPRREDPIEALREIEFDRATGKLSDVDYAALKARYTTQALAQMRAKEASPDAPVVAAAGADDDPAEAAVRRWRSRKAPACPEHGARPEPDAIYCSTCGRHLDGRCARCGANVTQTGAQFCASCGERLAA